MKMIKNMIATAILLLAACFATAPAFAVPVLGEKIFATGGAIEVEILNAYARYDSELHIYSPTSQYIATNRDVGTVVNLGTFSAGEELIFGIYVRNTGDTFYMGPGGRNADGIEHAKVDFLGAGIANISFEDLFGGGDRDYDDNMFQFRGGIAPTVPEPAALLLLGAGLLMMLSARRFRAI